MAIKQHHLIPSITTTYLSNTQNHLSSNSTYTYFIIMQTPAFNVVATDTKRLLFTMTLDLFAI